MRMWNIYPGFMCRQHLLGEHREIHTIIGMMQKGRKISGTKYITNGLIEIHSLDARHQELIREMLSRGYHHNSPFPHDLVLWREGNIDPDKNILELMDRCPECRKRIISYYQKYDIVP